MIDWNKDIVLVRKNPFRKKNKFKLILNFISKIFMYAVLVIFVLVAIMLLLYYIDAKKNASKSLPPLFASYVIVSPSMEPTIKVRDAIVIKRVEAEKLKVGDVITFISQDSYYKGLTVTHRIVEVVNTASGGLAYRTKGDNNNAPDGALAEYDHILGKVIFKIPKLGYIQHFLTQTYGWIIAIVIPCLGIIIYDVIKLVKAIGKKKKILASGDKPHEK